LTRDRRGIENTFLMHADRPGDRPRLLYWYRTAPGITLGRSPLDEDAIRAIEEQHPDIDFDWQAILALSEVMTPEDESAQKPQQREPRQGRRQKSRDRETESDSARRPRESADRAEESSSVVEPAPEDEVEVDVAEIAIVSPLSHLSSTPPSGLVDQLAGREIAGRLRARYDEIVARLQDASEASRASLLKRAEALDPDRWDTPEAVLQGVSKADVIFEELRAALAPPKD
jgi:hypothetical protein